MHAGPLVACMLGAASQPTHYLPSGCWDNTDFRLLPTDWPHTRILAIVTPPANFNDCCRHHSGDEALDITALERRLQWILGGK